MPPSLLKNSKTKMHAWVTNNALGGSQPAPSPHNGPKIPQNRHIVYQPASQPTTTLVPTHQHDSPPRSRAPIVNANASRAHSAATVGGIPVPSSRSAHNRNASFNMLQGVPHVETVSSEPGHVGKKSLPFWEGSTVDGSLFSDTASNVDANTVLPSKRRTPYQPTSYQPQPRPHHHPTEREDEVEDDGNDDDMPDQPPPFRIRSDGCIEDINGELIRSVSTPDARNHRGGFKATAHNSDHDEYFADGPYRDAPDDTPTSKRLQHPKLLPLRTSRRGSISERTAYQGGVDMASSPRAKGVKQEDDGAHKESPERHSHLREGMADPRRSTIFADTETPILSHADESEDESVGQQPQQPTPKPVAKAKTQLNRQLFSKNDQSKHGLRESAMPRPLAPQVSQSITVSPVRNHQPSSRKRHYELDYDDGALSRMDYTALKKEAFDYDPAQAEAQSAVQPLRGTLSEKLLHFSDKDEPIQVQFFSIMPVKEWEDSGDWFLEKFGEVMGRLKSARQTRRTVVESFENEIAKREEAVRIKVQGIDRTLAELKHDGEGMMHGVEVD